MSHISKDIIIPFIVNILSQLVYELTSRIAPERTYARRLRKILNFPKDKDLYIFYPPRKAAKGSANLLPLTATEDFMAINNLMSALLKIGFDNDKRVKIRPAVLESGRLPPAARKENCIFACSPKSNPFSKTLQNKLAENYSTQRAGPFVFREADLGISVRDFLSSRTIRNFLESNELRNFLELTSVKEFLGSLAVKQFWESEEIEAIRNDDGDLQKLLASSLMRRFLASLAVQQFLHSQEVTRMVGSNVFQLAAKTTPVKEVLSSSRVQTLLDGSPLWESIETVPPVWQIKDHYAGTYNSSTYKVYDQYTKDMEWWEQDGRHESHRPEPIHERRLEDMAGYHKGAQPMASPKHHHNDCWHSGHRHVGSGRDH